MLAQEKFSILLVDDDTTVVRILCRMLSEFAPLRFATSGKVALKLAREATPDLILLDIDMPEVSGFEVCKTLKRDPALKDVPVIFISGHDSPQLESKGFELGAADFISKPPNASVVMARVRTHQRLKMMSDTMRSAVTMDFLTGAVTRRQMEKLLTQECQRVQRTTAPLTLLLIDLVDFTEYNAEYGENQGDECLKAVAEALRGAAQRPTDTLGRWSGGRFALLLPETDVTGANTVAQRIVTACGSLPLHPDDPRWDQPGVQVAVGGATWGAARQNESGAEAPAKRAVNILTVEDMLVAATHAVERTASLVGRPPQIVVLSNESTNVTSGTSVR